MPLRYYNTQFSKDLCFLCSADITDSSTNEDVFPIWLQKKFNLQDQLLNLINGTAIPYRQIKIPCCPSCNNEYLSRIENVVSTVFDSGYTAFANLDKEILFLWLAKIFYGLLYKEHYLPHDRSNPEGNTIIPREVLTRYMQHHMFLTGAIRPMDNLIIGTTVPASIFVFNLQTPDEEQLKFDFRDDKPCMIMNLRIGEIGILACFDGGVTERVMKNHFLKYAKRPLHPIQFEELSAQFFYKARLLKRPPRYMAIGADSGAGLIQMSMHSVSDADFFDWNVTHYAHFLSSFTGIPVDKLHPEENKVRTWLHKTDDFEFIDMPLSKYHWRGFLNNSEHQKSS